jgi:hypothetical protein
MTRMDRVSAAMVAIRSSGQMIVDMMEAGTTIPPIQSCDDEETPNFVEIVGVGDSEAAAASCHKDGGYNHEFLVVAAQDAEEPEHNAGPGEDGEAYGDATDTNTNGIMAVDVEGLSGPEHDNGKEAAARDKCDDEGESEDSGFLLQTSWEHGILGSIDFPKAECY